MKYDPRLTDIKFYYPRSKGKCTATCPIFSSSLGIYPHIGSVECGKCGKMADIGSDADGPFVVCPEMNKALFQLNSFSCSKVLSRENIDELLFDVGLSGIAGRKRARLVEALRLLLFKNLYPRSKALIARERKLKFNEDALSLRSLTFSRFSSTLKLLLVGLLKTLSELNNVIVEIINYMDGSKPLEDIRYPGTKENPEFGDKL